MIVLSQRDSIRRQNVEEVLSSLTEVQTEILSAVKSFVDKEILPHATELDCEP